MEKKSLTLSMYCTCGDSLVARVREVTLADEMMRLFAQTHSGPGHTPCHPQRGQTRRLNRLPKDQHARTA